MKRQPRELIVLLDKLRARVKARELSEADWQLLAVLLNGIANGEDVRDAFYDYAPQKKGAAKKSANDEARRDADLSAIERAAYRLLEDDQRVTLPKVATDAKLKRDRVKDLTTKQALVAFVQEFPSYEALIEAQRERATNRGKQRG